MTEKMSSKPLLRGHFHQAAFFIALGACMVLLSMGKAVDFKYPVLIYSICLTSLFGISALYHRPHWKHQHRVWVQRMDHSAIFILIAGTGTPIFLLALPPELGHKLFLWSWIAASFGILQSLFWVDAPKWVVAILAMSVGWIPFYYFPEISSALQPGSGLMLIYGGVVYSIGAIVYATRFPNPKPTVFGYHEIFHILVIVAAALHFIVIARLV